jgi:hypothetical protein
MPFSLRATIAVVIAGAIIGLALGAARFFDDLLYDGLVATSPYGEH